MLELFSEELAGVNQFKDCFFFFFRCDAIEEPFRFPKEQTVLKINVFFLSLETFFSTIKILLCNGKVPWM